MDFSTHSNNKSPERKKLDGDAINIHTRLRQFFLPTSVFVFSFATASQKLTG
jgi:hypothetical protein